MTEVLWFTIGFVATLAIMALVDTLAQCNLASK